MGSTIGFLRKILLAPCAAVALAAVIPGQVARAQMINSIEGSIGYPGLTDYVATSLTGGAIDEGLQTLRADGYRVEVVPDVALNKIGYVSGLVTINVYDQAQQLVGFRDIPVNGIFRFRERHRVMRAAEADSRVVQYANEASFRGGVPAISEAAITLGDSGVSQLLDAIDLNFAMRSEGTLVDGVADEGSLTNSFDQWFVDFLVSFNGSPSGLGLAFLFSFERADGRFAILGETLKASAKKHDGYEGAALWSSFFGDEAGTVEIDLYPGTDSKGRRVGGATPLIVRHRAGEVQGVRLGYALRPFQTVLRHSLSTGEPLAIAPTEEVLLTPNARTDIVYEYPDGYLLR